MAVSRPLFLSHGSLETTILIPSDSYLFYQQLTSDFKKTLPEPTEGFAGDEEPSSKSELLTKFLGYVIDSNSIEAEKEQAVKLILVDFETRYLQSTDIHTFASQLLASEEYPTTLQKINNNLIKNYFAAKVYLKEDFTSSNASSALLKAASNDKALIFAIFGGQGNTDDYFEELREIYSTYNGLISEFLLKVQNKMQNLISSTSDIDRVYTDGFDFINWLKNPSQTPSTDNLLSIPVSCPLICVIQLCHYIITCKTLGLTPGQFKSYLKGTTGHSQGLVTSLVVASADSWDRKSVV